MSGNSVSNVNFIDSQGVRGQLSAEDAKRLEKQNILIFDATTNTYKVNTDQKGLRLQRDNENKIQTTRTTSFNSANLTAEEKKYLQEKGLIKSFSDNGCELGLPNNATDEDIQARMTNIKAALKKYNEEHPTPTTTKKTFTAEELAKVPEGQRQLLSGKVEVETTGKKYDFDVTTTETTTEKYDGIPTKAEIEAADLNDRSTRKDFENRYKKGLEQWLSADPKHAEDMRLSIAGEKYSKQIDKELNKLQKEYKADKPEALVKRFFENDSSNEVSNEQKENYKAFYGIANDVLNLDDKKLAELQANSKLEGNTDDNKKKRDEAIVLLNTHSELKNYLASQNEDLNEIRTNPEIRANTIRAFFAKTVGQDTLEAVLYKTAVDRVMDGRSAEQKVQDREDFLKYMSKRETQKVRDKQNVEHTQLFLTKEEAKAAEKAWKRAGKQDDPKAQFNYVGKAGLQMIENRPDYFCKPVENLPANPVEGRDYNYKVGDKYYKFDSKFYSDRIGKYFDNDGENYHATLTEIRDFAGENGKRIFIDKDGNSATYEDAFGNGNDIVGYKEGKRLRKSIDATGRSSDKDYTNSIRASYIAGQSLIAGATSFATAGLAAYAGGVISGVAQGAAQTFTAPGQTVHVDGETKWVKSVVTVNGRNYTVNTPVTIDPKDVKGAEQTFNRDGQKVGYNDKVNPLKVGLAAVPIGMAISLPPNIKKSYAKRDAGHTDDVVDLYRKPQQTSTTKKDLLDCSKTKLKRTLVNTGDGILQSLYEGENDVNAKLLTDLGQLNNPKARLIDIPLFKRNKTDVNMSDETQIRDVDNLRAQATISHRTDKRTAVHVEPTIVGKVRDFKQPKKITIEDETNGKKHTWTLEYRDRQATIDKYATQAKNLAQTREDQAFYQRTGIVANGRSIVDPDNHVEIYSMNVKATPKTVPVETPLGTLYVEVITYEYNGEQNENHIGVGANHTGIANKNAKSRLIRNSKQY